MRKFLFGACLLAITTFSGWSQTPAGDKSLLWEVSGKGLAQPSYVYGTIHLIPKKDFFLTESTKTAFQQAKKVTFEIDMDDMMDISTLLPMLMQSFMKNDTTLRDLLSPEEYLLVKEHFRELGLPMFMLDRIKPMFLTAMDPETMMGQQSGGADGFTSYEMEFMDMARRDKKSIEGLETAAFQMSMFDSIPYRAQAKMLVETIQSGGQDSTDAQFDQMLQLYKDQDIEGMQGIMDEDGGIAGYETLLLVNRNRRWIPVMEKMMNAGPTFFAVGAGHLGGPDGVVSLLRKAGYTLKPLP